MLLAAIDIGTNAVRLFISSAYRKNGRVVVEKHTFVRVPVRLGLDVFSRQRLSEEKIERLVQVMKAFKLLTEVYRPVAMRACATSAMREASNREEVIRRISDEAGISVEVIDGQMEAALIGSFSDLSFPAAFRYKLFIDVGGGSTELSLIKGQELRRSESFKIGTVRMLAKKVDPNQWEALAGWLDSLHQERGELLLIGSGGNINKLMKLYGNSSDKVLEMSQLEQGMTHLRQFSVAERIERLGLRTDRADVILPAAKIFHFIMRKLRADAIFVPKIGLSDGIVHQLFDEQSQTD